MLNFQIAQLYNTAQVRLRLSQCASDIDLWCRSCHLQLQLNADKRLVWIQGKSCQAQRDRLLGPSRFHDNVYAIPPLHLDRELSMKHHISKTVAACFYHLRRLRQI